MIGIDIFLGILVGFPLYFIVREMAVGSTLLLLTGLGLLATAFFQRGGRKFSLTFPQLAVFAGFLQGLAAIPGLSRSGATIFALSLAGLSPNKTLKLSYMMSLPVVLACSGYLFLKEPVLFSEGWIALIASFLTGILTLHFLLAFSKKIDFFRFALLFALLCFFGAFLGFFL